MESTVSVSKVNKYVEKCKNVMNKTNINPSKLFFREYFYFVMDSIKQNRQRRKLSETPLKHCLLMNHGTPLTNATGNE